MAERLVTASTFKQQCLALLDEVARTKVVLVVTMRGRPVARVVPVTEEDGARSTFGSVTLLATDDADYFSTEGAGTSNPPPVSDAAAATTHRRPYA